MSWIIYLAGVVGNIQGFFIAAAVACGVGSAAALMVGVIEEMEELRGKAFKGLGAAFAIGFLAAVIPSTTTIYMMVGANIAEAQITSTENQEVFGKVRTLVMQKLDEAIAGAGE